MRRALITPVLSCAGALAPPLAAQTIDFAPQPAGEAGPASRTAGLRPGAARRIVQRFDFEIADPFVPELPASWFRAQHDPPGRLRPGFPLDNLACLDFDGPAAAGRGSVRLPTGGGSVSLRMDPGAAPALSGADYLIEAQARTEGLTHARAFLVARLLDEAGEPIEGAESRSAPLRAAEWTPVSVLLKGDEPRAAFLQVDLELLQPEQFQAPTLGAHQIWPQDFSGSASFDEIIISQFPRIEISTTAPANIVLASEKPTLEVLVRDLTGERISARVLVQDIEGAIVDQREQALPAGRSGLSWAPGLERLGWYRATLEVLSAGQVVGAAHVDFIWVPDPSRQTASSGRAGRLRPGAPAFDGAQGSPDRARFGIIATELPPELRGEFAELVRRAGVGAVSVPAWTDSLTAESVERFLSAIGPVIEALALEWQDITLALNRLPREVAEAARVEASDPLEALGRSSATWHALLLPLLERYGQVVTRWQIGGAGARSLYFSSDLPTSLGLARDAIGEVVPEPAIIAPWPADQDMALLAPGADSLGGVIVSMPSHWPQQAVTELAADWKALRAEVDGQRELTLALRSEMVDEFGRAHGTGAMVRRMLTFWNALAEVDADGAAPDDPLARAALVDPWQWVGARRQQVMPAPELAAWRCLVDRLADRRIVGRYPLGPHVRCLILAPTANAPPSRGGALAIWREGASEVSAVELHLGAGEPRLVDVFGNEEPIGAGDGASPHEIRLGSMPVFIEGVDVNLVQFLASLRIEPAFLTTTSLEHTVELTAANPWPVGLAGRLFVRAPGGVLPDGSRDRSWRITPRSAQFDIPPGAEVRIPLTLAFGGAEPSGAKALELELDITAETSFRQIRASVPFEVGLRDFALDLSWRLGSGEGDIIVEAQITNTTDRPVSLDVACFGRGYARQSATVAALPPGGAISRQFVFQQGLGKLRGEQVVVTLTDMQTGGRLNGALGF
ncbi:MAG: hypothetical protein ACF8R7_02815 [Phycisphaerales bacterium JB039]